MTDHSSSSVVLPCVLHGATSWAEKSSRFFNLLNGAIAPRFQVICGQLHTLLTGQRLMLCIAVLSSDCWHQCW
jgi:hypothetical protein